LQAASAGVIALVLCNNTRHAHQSGDFGFPFIPANPAILLPGKQWLSNLKNGMDYALLLLWLFGRLVSESCLAWRNLMGKD